MDEDVREKIENAIMFERNMTRKMLEQESKKQLEQRAKVESSRNTSGVRSAAKASATLLPRSFSI